MRLISLPQGHVIGFFHEHQRSDRDKYIDVNFKNMEGYDAAVKAVEGNEDDHTIEMVRQMDDLCNQYGFGAVLFKRCLNREGGRKAI